LHPHKEVKGGRGRQEDRVSEVEGKEVLA